MNISLVCIAKNETPYIEEWVNYHLKLGFNKIFIYENNWLSNLINDNVYKIPFNGERQQIPSYNHFIKTYRDEFDWAAFLDIDEFLVLKKHKTIHEFMYEFKDETAVGINWVLFGDNNLTFNGDYNVLKRFTKRQSEPNIHIKSIVNPKKVDRMYVHNHNGEWVDTNKIKHNNTPFNFNPIIDTAQINHYFVKTKDEFLLKRNRGRADNGQIRDMNDFDNHNFNDIEDLTAYNFYNNI